MLNKLGATCILLSKLSNNIGVSSHALSNFGSNLVDSYGRKHDYLRISLTERCNLRCRYCMPEEGVQLTDKNELLSLDEFKRISDLFVRVCGVKKIRLTGGEPTVDKRLQPLLEHLNSLRSSGLSTIALTTNGLTLARFADSFKDRGLDTINISLDTLKSDRYLQISRRNGLNLALNGIKAALKAEITSVKLNCVVLKGFNDDELWDFVEVARQHPIEVRFIEFMPFESNNWSEDKMVSYIQMLAMIRSKYPLLERVRQSAHDVSKVYTAPGLKGSIGFISSMSENFCSGCSRLRLTADGNLKVCLFGREEVSIRDLMRNGATDIEIVDVIRKSLAKKWAQHSGAAMLERTTYRPMSELFNLLQPLREAARSQRGDRAEEADAKSPLTHLDSRGQARMVDVGGKEISERVATAQGRIHVGLGVLEKILDSSMGKGDVLSVSRIAGIMAAKQTDRLIPLCHKVSLDAVSLDIEACRRTGSLIVRSRVKTRDRTGVEMESLVAVSVALLTVYDMCKSQNKSMRISDVELTSKSKSRAG